MTKYVFLAVAATALPFLLRGDVDTASKIGAGAAVVVWLAGMIYYEIQGRRRARERAAAIAYENVRVAPVAPTVDRRAAVLATRRKHNPTCG